MYTSTAQLGSVVLQSSYGSTGCTHDTKYICSCPEDFDTDPSSLYLYRTMVEAMHTDY